MGSSFADEIDNLSFFENMDDLVEFPSDNDCCNSFIGSGDCNDFSSIWNEAFPDTVNIFPGTSSASELPADISLPDHDMAGHEWYTAFMEESFSGGGNSLCDESLFLKEKSHNYQFQTSSPVSVLESSSTTSSSSSCSGEKVIPRASRSKRTRPATFNPRPTSSFSGTRQPITGFGFGMSSDSDNVAESSEPIQKLKPEAGTMMITAMEEVPQKKKKLKLQASPLGTSSMDNINENATAAQTQAQAVRKCLHCEITKTPQWRAGPMGPKTLCNACGVRYKSGRLFPEYRPAASPTFVPSLHSNSHKKVIEMRNKEVYIHPPAEAESSHRGLVVADTNTSSSAVEYI